MDLYQEYKDLYYKEIENSDRLNHRVSTSLSFLTIIGAGDVFIIRELVPLYPFRTAVSIVFLGLCLLSFTSFILCIINFIRAYTGYTYHFFPTMGIKEFVADTHRLTRGRQDGERIFSEYIEKSFGDLYINCAAHNMEQNMIKGNQYRVLTVWIIRTFFMILVNFLFWVAFISNIK
jgi:hypothetical protein